MHPVHEGLERIPRGYIRGGCPRLLWQVPKTKQGEKLSATVIDRLPIVLTAWRPSDERLRKMVLTCGRHEYNRSRQRYLVRKDCLWAGPEEDLR